jgi:CrcB protein
MMREAAVAVAHAAPTSHSPTLALALLVAAAGGVGAVLRALVIHHVGRRRSDPLPLGTIVVNASGSLLLGILTGLSLYHGLGPHDLAVAGVGLCGGYTTWSTASWESIHLLHDGHRSEALLYTFGGLAVCLAAAAAGIGLTAIT